MHPLPQPLTVSVNYSVGVKVNIGNYESTDGHFWRSETWDVAALSQDEIDAFYQERLQAIKNELDGAVTSFYEESK
ncbi:MAG: hypothetical protein KGL39_46540 [Patescibacteria group bacterium]|nr:hypothetical protein [Patescibacteria group bacterium]